VLKVCSVKFGPPCANVPPPALKAPSPKFPKEALQKKIDGHVLLDVVVDKNGLAHDIRVLQPLGYGCDEEAIKSVEKWRFSPATLDGQPVAVEIMSMWNFIAISLNDPNWPVLNECNRLKR